jgi:hypothetical protein
MCHGYVEQHLWSDLHNLLPAGRGGEIWQWLVLSSIPVQEVYDVTALSRLIIPETTRALQTLLGAFGWFCGYKNRPEACLALVQECPVWPGRSLNGLVNGLGPSSCAPRSMAKTPRLVLVPKLSYYYYYTTRCEALAG